MQEPLPTHSQFQPPSLCSLCRILIEFLYVFYTRLDCVRDCSSLHNVLNVTLSLSLCVCVVWAECEARAAYTMYLQCREKHMILLVLWQHLLRRHPTKMQIYI